MIRLVDCPLCGGYGRFDDIECPQCERSGRVPLEIYRDAVEARDADKLRPAAAATVSTRSAERAAFPERVETDLEVCEWRGERLVVLAVVFIAGVAAHPTVVALLERVVHA